MQCSLFAHVSFYTHFCIQIDINFSAEIMKTLDWGVKILCQVHEFIYRGGKWESTSPKALYIIVNNLEATKIKQRNGEAHKGPHGSVR